MNDANARQLAAASLAPLRRLEYVDLVRRFIGAKSEWYNRTATSGWRYRVRIYGLWDDRPGGVVRVLACVDDYSKLMFMNPVCAYFCKTPDGRLSEPTEAAAQRK